MGRPKKRGLPAAVLLLLLYGTRTDCRTVCCANVVVHTQKLRATAMAVT